LRFRSRDFPGSAVFDAGDLGVENIARFPQPERLAWRTLETGWEQGDEDEVSG
jgi:hypothetical protein